MFLGANQMKKPRILVVGDVMLDHYLFGSVTRISPEAPVPIVSVTRDEYRPGGAGNVAMNLLALGCEVALMTVTGDDQARDTLFGLMDGVGKKAFIDHDIPTTTKLRVVSGQHLLRIDRDGCVLDSKVLCDMDASFAYIVHEFDAVIMSDYGKGVLSSFEMTRRMVHAAKTVNVPVFVDPKGTDFDRYQGVTAITPNLNELRAVVGPWANDTEMLAKASRLREDLDLPVMLLTRGDEGMTLLSGGHPVTIPTVAREVFDVSGAGDTVVAVFATMFAMGHSFHDSALAANRAAGVVVGKQGTATVSWAEFSEGPSIGQSPEPSPP
jgi:rfaE bifunctional protein kinase chain/domain